MRTVTSNKTVTIRMRGTTLNPAPEDREEVNRVVKALSKECGECGGKLLMRHDKRKGYKELEVICQHPVKLIEK